LHENHRPQVRRKGNRHHEAQPWTTGCNSACTDANAMVKAMMNYQKFSKQVCFISTNKPENIDSNQ